MDKNGLVTISEWYKGMAKYPLQGFGLLQNVDILTNPGVVSIGNKTTLSFTPNGIPVAEVKDGSDVYTLTNNGSSSILYKNGTSLQTGLSQGRDLLVYKDYLLVTHGSSVSCYGPLSSGSAQFFNGISGVGGGGVNSSYYAKMLYGQDDIVYITNGADVASLVFSASGTPGVQPTVTYNSSAVDLPAGHYGVTLAEVGKFLAIGTQTGTSWAGSSSEGRVYLWDRVSSSVNLPVIFNEDRVFQLYSHANRLYVIAGSKGNVYVTDGANFSRIGQIPFTTLANSATLRCYPNAVNLSNDGSLLIGTSTSEDAFPDSPTKHGVWEMDIMNTDYPVLFKKTISSGNYGSDNPLYIGVISSDERIGWQDGSSYGVDRIDTTPYESYGGIIHSKFIQVGNVLKKKSFSHIEFTLSENLVSGQGVKISYRKSLADDFTEIGTWDFATVGGVSAVEDKALIADAQFIQLKIELNQDSGVSVSNNVNLIRVQLW